VDYVFKFPSKKKSHLDHPSLFKNEQWKLKYNEYVNKSYHSQDELYRLNNLFSVKYNATADFYNFSFPTPYNCKLPLAIYKDSSPFDWPSVLMIVTYVYYRSTRWHYSSSIDQGVKWIVYIVWRPKTYAQSFQNVSCRYAAMTGVGYIILYILNDGMRCFNIGSFGQA